MESFEKVYEIVKSKLSEKRFYHSVCTMERCVEYAKIYGIDEEVAKLVGIAHDIVKETPKDVCLEEAEKYQVELDEIEKVALSLVHAKVGAEVCRKEFGFTEEMVDAVKYHTTGRENMTVLEKITYLADATGSDREYEESNVAYELAKTDLDKALVYFFKKTIEWTIEDEKLLHPDTIKAYNYLVK
ncbi:MAG: bis(5'-nucleosyl)-tetraphosphatase (symmetrical) YqeK [Clostridia bacterium]|nr:bis(5'-nucleosyl)-tetraphosphatase (symmetrical) YqeK [Clostridia bacterium]